MRWILVLFFLLIAAPLTATELDLKDLEGGGYVLYFRHAEAEVGRDCKDPSIPDWWQSRNPQFTRQLTARGRGQAKRIGKGFRDHDIHVDRVYCSEFTRTWDTARLMSLGRVRARRELTPLAYGDERELEKGIRELLSRRPQAGTVTVLVGHGHVLPWFEDLNEGDCAVFEPGEKPKLLGIVRFTKWIDGEVSMKFESSQSKDRFSYGSGIVTIQSERGIGKVTLRPSDGEWPPFHAVRFEYLDGRGMRILEGLDIAAGKHRFQNPETSISNGAMEWRTPSDLFRDVESITIHWVDFYR